MTIREPELAKYKFQVVKAIVSDRGGVRVAVEAVQHTMWQCTWTVLNRTVTFWTPYSDCPFIRPVLPAQSRYRRHYIRVLHKVIHDIFILVLDARDPEEVRRRERGKEARGARASLPIPCLYGLSLIFPGFVEEECTDVVKASTTRRRSPSVRPRATGDRTYRVRRHPRRFAS